MMKSKNEKIGNAFLNWSKILKMLSVHFLMKTISYLHITRITLYNDMTTLVFKILHPYFSIYRKCSEAKEQFWDCYFY
jgi:hypothetical protein